MLSYRARRRHWTCSPGARSARAIRQGREQVQFRLDRAAAGARSVGSSGSGTPAGRTTGRRSSISSPPARRRTARTGLFKWRRAPEPRLRALATRPARLGRPPVSLDVPARRPRGYTDWSWSGRYHHIFGRLTYLGRPVHGYRTSKYGARLDKYGRAVYLDTFGSMRPRWRRENSFVTHKPTGSSVHVSRASPLEGGYAHPPGYPRRSSGPRERPGLSDDGRRPRRHARRQVAERGLPSSTRARLRISHTSGT